MGLSLGKWTKHKLMIQKETLVKYLPDTQLLSEDSFYDFLNRFGQVVVKPSRGSLGRGVIKVTYLGESKFEVHIGYKKTIIEGQKNTFRTVMDNCEKKKNIIQKVIPLATYNHRPFDIRVMVQRKKNCSNWEVTGKAVKVAVDGFFITNAAKEILTVEEAINNSSLPDMKLRELTTEIEDVSLSIARQLKQHYPKKRRIGIDMGIDDKGKVWIIEVNLRPSIAMFKILGDEAVLNKIRSFRNR